MGVMGVLVQFLLLHAIPTVVPLPFFIPVYVGLVAYMLCANAGRRALAAALLAFQFAPLPLAVQKEFANISGWANTGPNASPLKGAYLFDGNGLGSAVVDFSHCSWDAEARLASCHLPKFYLDWPAGLNLTAAGFDVTADAAMTGLGKDRLAITMPWQIVWFVYHVAYHARVDFHFDTSLTEAQVYENVCLSLTASPSPLASLVPTGLCTPATANDVFRRSTIVRVESGDPQDIDGDHGVPDKALAGDIWYGNTYSTPSLASMHAPILVADQRLRAGGTVYPAPMQFGDGYRLLPLATPNDFYPHRYGKTKLHPVNIEKAKKLSPYVIARDV